MPAEFEEKDGAPVRLKLNFGPGMESTSEVTAFHPPHTWSTQSDGWIPGSPPIANEWSIEAREGGTCIVRIVQSLFASSDDWDNQLEGAESGWPAFLRTLQIYLTHFRGQCSEAMRWMVPVAYAEAEAWERLITAVGITRQNTGQQWAAPSDTPALSGIVEYFSDSPCDALLRVDQPGPGVVALGAFSCGAQSMVAMTFYLYGAHAAQTVANAAPLWDDWFKRQFPSQ